MDKLEIEIEVWHACYSLGQLAGATDEEASAAANDAVDVYNAKSQDLEDDEDEMALLQLADIVIGSFARFVLKLARDRSVPHLRLRINNSDSEITSSHSLHFVEVEGQQPRPVLYFDDKQIAANWQLEMNFTDNED